MTSIPILILVLLVIVAFWLCVGLLLLGVLTGCRYRFVGPDLERESVERVMDDISATVDSVVDKLDKTFSGKKK